MKTALKLLIMAKVSLLGLIVFLGQVQTASALNCRLPNCGVVNYQQPPKTGGGGYDPWLSALKGNLNKLQPGAGDKFKAERHAIYEVQPNGQVDQKSPVIKGASALDLFKHSAFDPINIAHTVNSNFSSVGNSGLLEVELPKGYIPTKGDYFTSPEISDALNWATKEFDRSLTIKVRNMGDARFNLISGEIVLMGVKSVAPEPRTRRNRQ